MRRAGELVKVGGTGGRSDRVMRICRWRRIPLDDVQRSVIGIGLSKRAAQRRIPLGTVEERLDNELRIRSRVYPRAFLEEWLKEYRAGLPGNLAERGQKLELGARFRDGGPMSPQPSGLVGRCWSNRGQSTEHSCALSDVAAVAVGRALSGVLSHRSGSLRSLSGQRLTSYPLAGVGHLADLAERQGRQPHGDRRSVVQVHEAGAGVQQWRLDRAHAEPSRGRAKQRGGLEG
jgi:hypothetical protein